MTMKEAILSSFAAPRRHSRRYSRKSKSTSEAGMRVSTRAERGVEADIRAALSSVTRLRRLVRPLGRSAKEDRGKALDTTTALAVVHLGISPKCTQISR